VLIYKTPDASLMGQGLASTIDLRTLRPLDFGKRVLAASARKERIGFESGAELGQGSPQDADLCRPVRQPHHRLAVGITSMKEDNGGELKFDSWGAYLPEMQYNGQTVKVPAASWPKPHAARRPRRRLAHAAVQAEPELQDHGRRVLFARRGKHQEDRHRRRHRRRHRPYDPNGTLTNATDRNGIATSGTLQQLQGRRAQPHVLSNKDRLLSLGWNSELKLERVAPGRPTCRTRTA
jgi:iron complex outermembrane receptor protein